MNYFRPITGHGSPKIDDSKVSTTNWKDVPMVDKLTYVPGGAKYIDDRKVVMLKVDTIKKHTSDFSFDEDEEYKYTYNEAIEDFKEALLKYDVIDHSVVRRVAEQLKEEESNG